MQGNIHLVVNFERQIAKMQKNKNLIRYLWVYIKMLNYRMSATDHKGISTTKTTLLSWLYKDATILTDSMRMIEN